MKRALLLFVAAASIGAAASSPPEEPMVLQAVLRLFARQHGDLGMIYVSTRSIGAPDLYANSSAAAKSGAPLDLVAKARVAFPDEPLSLGELKPPFIATPITSDQAVSFSKPVFNDKRDIAVFTLRFGEERRLVCVAKVGRDQWIVATYADMAGY
jgi:hypothetical protein